MLHELFLPFFFRLRIYRSALRGQNRSPSPISDIRRFLDLTHLVPWCYWNQVERGLIRQEVMKVLQAASISWFFFNSGQSGKKETISWKNKKALNFLPGQGNNLDSARITWLLNSGRLPRWRSDGRDAVYVAGVLLNWREARWYHFIGVYFARATRSPFFSVLIFAI